MNDFIINVPSSQGPSILIWVPLLGGVPINSPLVGSFLGVLFAFVINYMYQSLKNHRDGVYYSNSIKSEIKACVERLEKVGNLLPADRWSSAKNSGALRLLKADEVDQLSIIYEGIQNYNYEAMRLRDLAEDSRRNPENEYLKSLWEKSSQRLKIFRDNLQELLREYLRTQLVIKADEAGAYYA